MPPATAARSKPRSKARAKAGSKAGPKRAHKAPARAPDTSADESTQNPPSAPANPSHPARLAALRDLIAGKSLSHILITDPRDVGYLTGFLGGDSYLLVPGDPASTPIIISDFRYQEHLAHFSEIARIVIRKATMLPCVAETLAAERVTRCGVQAEHMTLAERDGLIDQMGTLAGDSGKAASESLIATRGLLLGMRRIKDDHEVELLSAAIRIQQQAMLAVLPTIKPNQTELEIAARLEHEMKSRGSVEPAFGSIVAARTNGSLPHYTPGFAKTAKNQPLLIDWGATWEGYRGDMTRTFCLGKWPAKMREIYQIVLEAHIFSADALRAGRTTAEIDKIARDHITKAGYGEFFGHGLGHGIGINIHEEPRLTQQVAPSPLEAGNVLTIEPGIYLPGVGGVRLENDYLITQTGARCLCTLPLHIDWATLG